MRLSSRSSDRVAEDAADRGSAPLEFILVGLLMLVPLVYLVVTLGLIQGQSLGVEAASRHIARAVSTAPDAATAEQRADAVLAGIVDEYDLDPSVVDVSLTCVPTGSCPEPGALLTVTVTTRVALPLVPPVFGLDRAASMPLQATTTQKVSRFWGTS